MLLFVFSFGKQFEGGERLVPDRREMIAQHGDSLGIDFVDAASAGPAIADEAGLFEDAKVLGDRGTGDRKYGGQLVDGVGMAGKQLKDREASGVAQGLQSGSNVSVHLP